MAILLRHHSGIDASHIVRFGSPPAAGYWILQPSFKTRSPVATLLTSCNHHLILGLSLPP